MTILHLISRYRWTGSAEPAVNLCVFQAKAGAEARLCCIRGGSLEREALERGAELLDAAHLGRNYTPWSILSSALSLARSVERDRIDLLHAHTSHDHWLAALALAFFARKKVPLLRTHHETRRIRVGRVWRRIFNRLTTLNLTPSDTARDYFIESGAMLAEKVRTLYGGVDLPRLQPTSGRIDVRGAWGVPKNAPLIALLSHIGPDRRQGRMLEAFELLADEFPEAWLVFLGQGNKSTVRELKERVDSLPFARRVVFSKDTAELEIPWADQVATADRVVVLAVGSEGSSRGVMEAMALARPVIGARLGVLPELIEEGKTGYLVDPESPLSIAGALRESLHVPQVAHRYGAAAATVIRARFSCQRQADESLKLYREILPSS
jgi:glycosyltransferase involved in cell wall biosynthesis